MSWFTFGALGELPDDEDRVRARSQPEYRPAYALLLVLSGSIFVLQYAFVAAFPYLATLLPAGTVDVVHAALLTLFLFPLLLVFVLRPMMRQIAAREKTQAALRTLADGLESRVREQTAALRTEIEERKQAAESLKLFRSLMDKSLDAIAIIDPDTARVLDANEEACNALGYTREELLTKRVFDFDPLVDQSEYTRRAEELRKSGSWSLESLHRRKDGTTYPIEVTLRYVSLGRDYIVSVARDITERLRTEEERKRLAMAVEHAAETIVITDTTGAIVYVNPAFEKITGYTRDEAVGQNPRILKSGKQGGAFYAHLWETISRGEVWRGNMTNKRKDGSLYEEDATISPVRDSRGNVIAFVAIKRDITEQLNLEAQLRQSQKMEAIGGLAAGIAHDFNNILAAILGYTQIAMLDMAADDPLHKHLEQVEKASLRARDLVQHILTFSRQTEAILRPVRLDVIIEEVLKLLRASLPRIIEFRADVQPLDHLVRADSTQIHQVIMNLCTNAAHAMRVHGGVLEVSLRSIEVDRHTPKASLELNEGLWAQISVSDTGHGMDSATVNRIFEPFFTTKHDEGGTGLGLSTVHGIVKQHGGTITVYSEPGQGTVFHIYLPLILGAEEDASHRHTEAPRGNGERVLVVDDEEPVALMTAGMLEKLGYTVTVRTSAVEAIATFRADPGQFDLVITDQTMPQMTGRSLIAELRRIRPDIVVLMATGYGANVDERSLQVAAILLKPVLFDQLAVAVRAALQPSTR
ncbi:MAG: PAS domain S-box protein [Candidatus Hydrogenedentes bacterium]|nr:PAS domain S-box protein [Candidatus Hydrogenedentota bacterium]